ncbi:unnamed protein product [Brachionus calyciflorus]|uniref:peptidylamidoglycolate lyase n=1 Tax=Brachionus calyciflorus TaxID=104777 RepID=A0A813WAE8_9BILA|nr:unnamed protein product [Brachionus calyciflorus]
MNERSNKEKQVDYYKIFHPSEDIKLKNKITQVGGLDTDMNGNLLVFHRGSRAWKFDSFLGNNFNKDKYKAIAENTLTLIDVKKKTEIGSWGANRYYMPHGLTIDFENNIWVTDVGLHQVFKFSLDNLNEPELVLGVEFTPGNDENHLCKPTDVSVSESTGHVFVSDGYCNQRIIEFDQNGNYLGSYEDKEKPLQVAHSVSLIEKLNLVCTVSRQEGRIVCFDITSRKKKYDIRHDDMKNCYAIEYDPNNQLLHAATGYNSGQDAYGFTFYADHENFGQFKQKWNSPKIELNEVHDLALSPDGSTIYMGQLNGEIDEFTYE